MNMSATPAMLVVGVGEALYDILATGDVFGGAPVNFAVQARQLLDRYGPDRSRVAVATRVGDIDLGRGMEMQLISRGLETRAVQRDPLRPTGTATVSLVDGDPHFTIMTDVAWDYCQIDDAWRSLAAGASAVCYGTLGSRSPASAVAIESFLKKATTAVRLFDVNLRAPYYSANLVRRLCGMATMLKDNERELGIVADAMAVPPGASSVRMAKLREAASLEAVILTRGTDGASIVTATGVRSAPACTFPAAANADAVGAGDAFYAAVVVGRLLGWSISQTLEVACETAGFVASQQGATPRLPG